MKILIDTNIIIGREDYKEIPENLSSLLSLLSKINKPIVIHPASIEDINRDKDTARKKITLSKIKAYPALDSPPNYENDGEFLSIVGIPTKPNDIIDTHLIYAVYKNAVDFLVTEDGDLRKKSALLKLSERILSVDESIDYLNESFVEKSIHTTSSIKIVKPYNLDISDAIFAPLKSDYQGFDDWWKKISKEGRDVLILNKADGSLGALLILKIEDEPIYTTPPQPKKKRVKICTMVVTHTGYKIGELFIKKAIEKAILNQMDEIYLTHYVKSNDLLVNLIEEFGFVNIGSSTPSNGETLFLKKLKPDIKLTSFSEIREKYYPSFYDGIEINKFIIPIRPEFHERLFPEFNIGQQKLFNQNEIIVEGNTIKKAYLCHANTMHIKQGDVLLFYRSQDSQGITCLGIVDEIHNGIKDAQEIIRLVGKRSVYTHSEIMELSKKPTKVIIFRWHFNFQKLLNFRDLKFNKVLKGPPQSIMMIEQTKYEIMKQGGIIYAGFAIDKT